VKEKQVGFMDFIKEIIRCYFFAFVFVFICLFINQFLLVRDVLAGNQLTVFQKIMLMVYLIPPIIVMASPFAVCIGFVQGLAGINIIEKKMKNGREFFIRKIIIPVLILSIIISALTFVVSDYVLPNTNVYFSNIHRTALIKTGRDQSIISLENSPRHMNSKRVVQGIKNIQMEKEAGFERKLNMWKLELHKKYSIPLGAFFLSLFAISLSLIIKDHRKISFCICLFSCVLYWAVLMYGQTVSIKNAGYGILAMWLPNILFLCISYALYLRCKKINNPQKGFNVA
jgi:lipopolysaccharide export LptBFGC system permease protein LptF